MTPPYLEHNCLLATREFLLMLLNEEKIINSPEKLKLSAKSFLEHYPTRDRLNELYDGDFISNPIKSSESELVNNNQTWDTPGFKWKTEVEFTKNK